MSGVPRTLVSHDLGKKARTTFGPNNQLNLHLSYKNTNIFTEIFYFSS